LCVLLVWARNLASEKGVRILGFGQIARQREQIDCLPVEIWGRSDEQENGQ
jgi:hypothetical protein